MLKLSCALPALMIGLLPTGVHAQGAVPGGAQTATGQETPSPEEEESEGEIVVSGVLRGAVPGDIPPEVQLGPGEIRAYGASNVSDLIGQLSAQLGTSQGRGGEQPVILLSGRRSSMNEIGTLPSEAIERVDILPEEVALRYGYSATQKVINVVLRPRFQALTTEIEGRMPTDGGNAGGRATAGVDVIRRSHRLSLNAQYDRSSGILESERGVSRGTGTQYDLVGNIVGNGGGEIDPALSALAGTPVTVAGVPGAAAGGPQGLDAFTAGANDPNVTDAMPYRTLVSPQQRLQLDAVYSRTLSPKLRGNATIQYVASSNESLQGLPGVRLDLPAGNPFSPFSRDVDVLRYIDGIDPLRRLSDSRTLTTTGTLNGEGVPWSTLWNWSVEANYERRTSSTTTDTGIDPTQIQGRIDRLDPTLNPFGTIPDSLIFFRPDNVSTSQRSTAQIEAFTNGPLFSMPAGKVNLSFRLQGRTMDSESESFISGVTRSAEISRDSGAFRGNIDVPLTSRRYGVLGAIGDLSVNANFEVEQLSDFGRLTTTGYGFNWTPIPQIRAVVRWTRDSNAPNPERLNDPLVVTPNVRAYDFVRGESVDITSITGGNPALRADTRHVFNARFNIRPTTAINLNFVAAYTNQHYRNQAQGLPAISAEVEAAFPDRFVRDSSGRLVSVDYRAVNIDRYDRQDLRWGFNFFQSLPSPAAKRRQEQFAAFQKAREESRRTGEPMPPEMVARVEQMRRLGFQQSIFGSQRPGQGQSQGQGQGQNQRPQGEGQGAGPGGGQGRGPGGFGGGQGRGPGGGGGFGGRGGGGGGGNGLDLAVYHTWVFEDQIVIRPGLPVLDRLDGASANGGAGISAHRIELQGGVSYEGYRLRLNGTWDSATEVSTGALGSGDRLNFGSIAKLNLTAQVDLGQQLDLLLKHPWLRGSRVSLNVDNLFNARQRVTDENGVVPSAYQPFLRDPLGRVVRLTFRKQLY